MRVLHGGEEERKKLVEEEEEKQVEEAEDEDVNDHSPIPHAALTSDVEAAQLLRVLRTAKRHYQLRDASVPVLVRQVIYDRLREYVQRQPYYLTAAKAYPLCRQAELRALTDEAEQSEDEPQSNKTVRQSKRRRRAPRE